MTSTIVPPVDLAPGMPSRVVTISATDVTEGGQSMAGQMVRFALSDTLDVTSGGDVIAKTQAEVVLDANGEGSIRLPVYDEDVKTWCGKDWAILVTATWGSQKAIRVPAGTGSIALSALPPVRPLRGRELQWAITGVSTSVTEGATWGASVSLSGGILDFDFTVPPGGVAYSRGILDTHADSLVLQEHVGVYRVSDSATATGKGLPENVGGTLTVARMRGGATTATALQEYVTEFGVPYRRRRNSTSGWLEWERTDVAGAVAAGVAMGARVLAAGDDVDDLVLHTHTGPWRVPDAGTAAGVSHLPVSQGGVLDVGYVRGGASAGVTLQEYVTELGVTYRRRRNSYSGWLEWEEAREGTTVVVGALPVTHVDVILTAGQSNMVGFATPFGPSYGDTPDGRIWMYGAKGRELTPATVPLDNHGGEGAAGISMATFFAREWTRHNPVDSIALLVPAAHGGTGFDPSAEWNWRDATGPSSLREAMMDQLTDAVAAAEAQWPDAEVRVRAMLWHQGESSTSITDEADYVAAFGDVIGDVRALWPDTPAILGELSPDRAGGVSGTVTGRAHQIIPAEIPGTALAHTRPNGSREGDTSHLGREGAEQVGRAMFEAYPAALSNRDGVLVMPPHSVWAWRDGGRVMVEWSAPLCRATEYQVQTWDGSAWVSPAGLTITGRRAEITGASALTHVRVATVGASATSRWTAGTSVGATVPQ